MEKQLFEQYELDSLLHSVDSVKSFARIALLMHVFRAIFFVIFQNDPNKRAFIINLLIGGVISCVTAYIFPFVSAKILLHCSPFWKQTFHISYCIFFAFFFFGLPIIKGISEIEDDFFRGFSVAPMISLSMHMAMDLCRKKYLASLCLIGCYALVYIYVPTKSSTNSEFFINSFTSALLGLMLLWKTEDTRKANFLLKKALAITNARYKYFLEALPLKVIIFSYQTGILYQNSCQSLSESFVYKQIETNEEFSKLLKKLKCKDNLPLEDQVLQMLSKEKDLASENDIVKNIECTTEEADIFRIFRITILGSYLFEEDKTIGIMLEDITEKRLFEQEKNARQNATSLLYSLSHELKTPLNIIIGAFEEIIDFFKDKSNEVIRQITERGKLSNHFKPHNK